MARKTAAQRRAEQEAAEAAAAEQAAAEAATTDEDAGTTEGADGTTEGTDEGTTEGADGTTEGAEEGTDEGTDDADAEAEGAEAEGENGVPGAPLEPPAARPLSTPDPTPNVAGALSAAMAEHSVALVDEATGESPDPETMFTPVIGSVLRCEVRLLERVTYPTGSPTSRLVLPAGQTVSADNAARIIARVRAQLAATAE